MKKIFAVILTVFLLLIHTSIFAISTDQAKEPVSIAEPCDLTLEYSSEGKGFAELTVELYQVAEMTSDIQFIPSDDFKAASLKLNGITSQSEWNTMRTTIESFVAANGVKPLRTAVINENGRVTFEGLKSGLYYVPSKALTSDGFRYYFQSVLVSLPDLDAEGAWNYAPTVKPKPDVRPPSSDDLEYSVIKLWKGSGDNDRPRSVAVDIIKDMTVVKTVVLSAENNWKYTWYAEDDESVWTVAEKNRPENYTVTVEKNQTAFSVVNTYNDPDEPPPQTGDTGNIVFYAICMCISGAVLLTLGLKRKKVEE